MAHLLPFQAWLARASLASSPKDSTVPSAGARLIAVNSYTDGTGWRFRFCREVVEGEKPCRLALKAPAILRSGFMSWSTLPSLRVILFTVFSAEVVRAVVTELERLGQRVPLVVTTPGPVARPNEEYKDLAATLWPTQDVLVTRHVRRLPAFLKGLAPDLLFVAGFPWRLPAELLALPRLGCVNAHPSLLPRYRGPNPLFWQLINGETQGGLTMHRMDAHFDTGPILTQRAIEIAPDDDVDSLYPKLLAVGLPMLAEVLQAVIAGDPGRPQSDEGASYAPLATEAERWLDWGRPATQLHNQIRGWGQEGALGRIDGHIYLVRRARVVSLSARLAATMPGTLLDQGAKGILIRTGQDALLLEALEPAR